MTPRQERFVHEYLIDLNATQAAVRAGYSKHSVKSSAWRLLARPQVKVAVAEGMAARAARTQVTADRVVQELAAIAFTDLRQVADWGPEGIVAKPAAELNPTAARAVAEVSESGSGASRRVKVKLHDKKGALDLLARHLGLYLDKEAFAKASGDGGLPPLKVILHGTAPPPEAD